MKSVTMLVAVLLLPALATAVNVSYDFTDGSWAAGSTAALAGAGFTYNSAITPTTDMDDLNQYRDAGFYMRPTKNLFAVYNDTSWASTGTAAYLTCYDQDGSKPYPSAYFGLGANATAGSIAISAAAEGRADEVWLKLKSGSTVLGAIYLHKNGAQLNGSSGYYNAADLNIISTVDTGSTYLYKGYAAGISMNWTVNADGTGGMLTATGSYNGYAWGGSAVTKSASAAFTNAGVPDTLEIYCGYYNEIIGMKSFAVNTVPEPCTMALLGIGVVGLLRKRK